MEKDYYNGAVAPTYYDIAEYTNANFSLTAEYKKLAGYISSGMKICEFGCGEGGKIQSFQNLGFQKYLYGIDISAYAIAKAQTRNSDILYNVGDITQTNFEDDFFDVSMSFFVYEHLPNPLDAFHEMYRTTKKGGYIFLWFPNFGSPLFPSPPTLYGKNTLQKIGIISSRIFRKSKTYENVLPIEGVDFQPDFDTTAEIHMGKFVGYIHKKYNIQIIEESSKWENIEGGNILFKLYTPFKFFGKGYCKYWGPQCFLILKKND